MKRFQRGREELRTGQVQLRWSQPYGGKDTVNYFAQFSPKEVAAWNLGDDDGVIGKDPERGDRAHVVLCTPAQTWSHESDDVIAILSDGPRRHDNFFPLRTLAAGPSPPRDDLETMLWRSAGSEPAARSYSEEDDGHLKKVIANDPGHGRTTWWIDPARDWEAVRITFERDGQVLCEMRSDLTQYDGRWFPQNVEYYRYDYQDGNVPAERFEVVSAAFNRPDQPERLEPRHIGIETGFVVQLHPPLPGRELMVWDGARPVPLSEFGKRERAGEVRRGSRNEAALEALPAPSPELIAERTNRSARTAPASAPAPAAPPPEATRSDGVLSSGLTAWQRYTEEFIATYRLTEDQAARARRICSQCEKIAKEYVERHRESLLLADEVLQKASPAALRAAEPASPEARALSVMKALQERLDLIFTSQLKPRLEVLPTRAQRSATQPANR